MLGVIFLGMLLLGPCLHAQTAPLPATAAESLTGQKMQFPSALKGMPAVCVFSFSREATEKTRAWMTPLNQDGINVWSVVELEAAPAMVHGMIRSSMRKSTPPALQAHSLILTKDDKAWKRALAMKDDKLPVVMVLDTAGRVVWTHEGLYSGEAYEELKTKLTER